MKVLVIDGQGGGVGKQIVESVKARIPRAEVFAVGTNVLATQAMLKAGADHGATGENAVAVNCRDADVIVGPICVVIADSLYGEISPKMAMAVGQSPARRVLIPMNVCDNYIPGVSGSVSRLIEDAVNKVNACLSA